MEDPGKESIRKMHPDEESWGDTIWDVNKALDGNTLGSRMTDDQLKDLVQQADDIAKSALDTYGKDIHPSLHIDLGLCARKAKEKKIPAPNLEKFLSQGDAHKDA